MRYGVHQKRDTRERVLCEAARAFRAQGPQGVSVQDVMRRAGLTHGGFYAHFASKDELLCKAIERMFDEALQRWELATVKCPPAQGLLNYFNIYLSHLHVERPQSGCPIAALASDQPRLSPKARQAFAAGTDRLQQAIASHLEQMGYAQPTQLAVSVLNELAGAIVLARCAPDRRRSGQTLEASRSQLVARLGLAAPA
jgi:TetR/AcrR family transcriptional regulator, transcriptional repressor for nem operon